MRDRLEGRSRRLLRAVNSWWFEPLPRARIAWLRTFVYVFIFLDIFLLRPWVADNGTVPASQYHALMVGRILPLPTPTPLVVSVVKYGLLLSAGVALTGKYVRVAGVMVFLLYFEWMLIAFSYGKVDHDRVAFLVALAVLPTVGSANWKTETSDEESGWAVRCIQLSVVATYFLAAFAKVRFGGVDWVNGATLMRSLLRRGTFLTSPLEDQPMVLRAGQYLLMIFELTSPLMLVRGVLRRVYLIAAFSFHLVTYAAIEIFFWPHVLCLLSFVPLERLGDRVEQLHRPRRKLPASTPSLTGAVKVPPNYIGGNAIGSGPMGEHTQRTGFVVLRCDGCGTTFPWEGAPGDVARCPSCKGKDVHEATEPLL